jgi:hypothetical protein
MMWIPDSKRMPPVDQINCIAIITDVPAVTGLSILTIAATSRLEEVPGEFANGDSCSQIDSSRRAAT